MNLVRKNFFIFSKSDFFSDKRTSAWLKLKKDYVTGLSDSLDLVCVLGIQSETCCLIMLDMIDLLEHGMEMDVNPNGGVQCFLLCVTGKAAD